MLIYFVCLVFVSRIFIRVIGNRKLQRNFQLVVITRDEEFVFSLESACILFDAFFESHRPHKRLKAAIIRFITLPKVPIGSFGPTLVPEVFFDFSPYVLCDELPSDSTSHWLLCLIKLNKKVLGKFDDFL